MIAHSAFFRIFAPTSLRRNIPKLNGRGLGGNPEQPQSNLRATCYQRRHKNIGRTI